MGALGHLATELAVVLGPYNRWLCMASLLGQGSKLQLFE